MKTDRIPPSAWKERLQSEWSVLLDETEAPSVFLAPEWLIAWQRHFGGDRDAFAVTGRDETGRLIGLAVF